MNNIPSDDPRECAEKYVLEMNAIGFKLGFTVESLKENVDLIIETYRNNSPDRMNPYHITKYGALTAFIGEALIRAYQGSWSGEFYCDRPEINYYTSKIVFDTYTFWPSHWIGYALANGRKTTSAQSFSTYLDKEVIPKITGTMK